MHQAAGDHHGSTSHDWREGADLAFFFEELATALQAVGELFGGRGGVLGTETGLLTGTLLGFKLLRPAVPVVDLGLQPRLDLAFDLVNKWEALLPDLPHVLRHEALYSVAHYGFFHVLPEPGGVQHLIQQGAFFFP